MNTSNNTKPIEAGVRVLVSGYLDGKDRPGIIAGHGYGKNTGALIYWVDVTKTIGFEGWSGGARPVMSRIRVKASAPFVKIAY